MIKLRSKEQLPPIYDQIKRLLEEKIENGEYLPGSKLPSERELSEQYKISRMTARNALTSLVNEGRAYRKQGKGTYVAKPKIKRDLLHLTGFSKMLKERGIEPSNYTLGAEIFEADKIISEKFNISIGEEVYKITRLRRGNQQNFALEYSYLPVKLFPGLLDYDLEKDSLYRIIEEEYGFKLKFAKQWIKLAKANEYEAKVLEINPDTPILILESITYTKHDMPVEMTYSLTRGDLCEFYTELWSDLS
ncbi:GntR family transcriptional regulator [Tepidanaerobacter syntrophicus]|uniref:GntR family transcriptional regulator n=1 Tax=Tepidanaerobacter syntrophicus TaxID=224999 RepID=A0A0U9HPN4_9FIRM|nr:GntR family transcriptional regulator [Tepidanaerobacter syntrophicus]